jgi:hypothetical protein
LSDLELLLGLRHIGGGIRPGFGTALDRRAVGLLELSAQRTAVGGHAERCDGQCGFGSGGGADATLGNDSALVREQQACTADEMGGDRSQVDRSPSGPPGVGDVQPLVWVGDVGGGAIDGDGAGERPAEPCGESEVVQAADDRVAL